MVRAAHNSTWPLCPAATFPDNTAPKLFSIHFHSPDHSKFKGAPLDQPKSLGVSVTPFSAAYKTSSETFVRNHIKGGELIVISETSVSYFLDNSQSGEFQNLYLSKDPQVFSKPIF